MRRPPGPRATRAALLAAWTALTAACGGLGAGREAPAGPDRPAAPGQEAPEAQEAPAERLEPLAPGGGALIFHGRRLGVPVRLALIGEEGADLLGASRAAFAELGRLERRVNLWDPGSDLARWNGGPPGGGRVPPELSELVRAALGLCEATGGAYDPTVGALLAARGHYGDPVPLAGPAEALVGCDRVRIGGTARAPVLERVHPGVRLDLSGVAKGWAAERARDVLALAGVASGCLDLGGSTVLAFGPGPQGRGWPVRAPDGRGGVELLYLRDEALAVSGRTPRAVDSEHLPETHLVDPASGASLPKDGVLAIARGPSALVCDGWATAACVGARPGPEDAVRVRVVGGE